MERKQSQQERRTNTKRSDGRTSGGSRYADKATPVKRASGKGRRPAGRKRRRRNRQLLIILFLLVLIVCLAAGIALVHSRKKRSDQAQAESQMQELQKKLRNYINYPVYIGG